MRKCGECTLCCRLTPVRELHKPANTRCKHQRMGKGCAIYAKRPHSCALWNCRWLGDPDATAELSRPDRSHYVIDVMPDFVTALNNATGAMQQVQVLQVWIDPAYPLAHRDPALRAYLLRQGERGIAAIMRYGSDKAFVLFPPNMATDGQWHEQGGEMVERAHTMTEVEEALGGKMQLEIRET